VNILNKSILFNKRILQIILIFSLILTFNLTLNNKAYAENDYIPPSVEFPQKLNKLSLSFKITDNKSGIKYFAVSKSNQSRPTSFSTSVSTEGTILDHWYMLDGSLEATVRFVFPSEGKYYFWLQDVDGNTVSYVFNIKLKSISDLEMEIEPRLQLYIRWQT